MLADIRLREISGGRRSLDTALAQLQRCCMANGRTWRARDLFNKLDQLTDSEVFSTLYREHVPSAEFPDVFRSYSSLGIKTRFNRVYLLPENRKPPIRSAIMNG